MNYLREDWLYMFIIQYMPTITFSIFLAGIVYIYISKVFND